MNRAQFLDLLSQKLSEALSHNEVMNQVSYYDSYIRGEMAKGRSEEDVMTELGDPYMIARTIIDTHTGEAFEDAVYEESVNTEPVKSQSENDKVKSFKMGNTGCLLTVLLLVLIGAAVVSIVTGLISLLLPVLIPTLGVALVLFLLKKIFR